LVCFCFRCSLSFLCNLFCLFLELAFVFFDEMSFWVFLELDFDWMLYWLHLELDFDLISFWLHLELTLWETAKLAIVTKFDCPFNFVYFTIFLFLSIYVCCWNLCLLCTWLFSLHNSGHPAIRIRAATWDWQHKYFVR
jgi:hypothetical protein